MSKKDKLKNAATKCYSFLKKCHNNLIHRVTESPKMATFFLEVMTILVLACYITLLIVGVKQ